MRPLCRFSSADDPAPVWAWVPASARVWVWAWVPVSARVWVPASARVWVWVPAWARTWVPAWALRSVRASVWALRSVLPLPRRRQAFLPFYRSALRRRRSRRSPPAAARTEWRRTRSAAFSLFRAAAVRRSCPTENGSPSAARQIDPSVPLIRASAFWFRSETRSVRIPNRLIRFCHTDLPYDPLFYNLYDMIHSTVIPDCRPRRVYRLAGGVQSQDSILIHKAGRTAPSQVWTRTPS